MALDRREAILARLLALAAATPGVVTATRNEDEIAEQRRPAIVIYDGDEAAEEGDPQLRPNASPRRVAMTPGVFILLASAADAVGSEMNAIRAEYLKAVLGDAELASLHGSNGRIRYLGCSTGLAQGRKAEGMLGLGLQIQYPLVPGEL